MRKFQAGEEYDISLMKNLVKRKCLGDFIKDPNKLPVKCRHFWEIPEELSVDTKMQILSTMKNRRWRIITLIVSILGISISSLFAYLNFSKPSNEDLKERITNLEKINSIYEKTIIEKDRVISGLRKKISPKDMSQ